MPEEGPRIRTYVYPREDYWTAIQMMANRMAVSQEKYGALEENYPAPGNSLMSAEERIQKYLLTGNTEWLLDAANQIIIEHLCPSHPMPYFRATDSDESPGIPGVGDRKDELEVRSDEVVTTAGEEDRQEGGRDSQQGFWKPLDPQG